MTTVPRENETRGQRVRSTFARVAGRYAFSQIVVLPLLIVLTLGTMFTDSERQADHSEEWIYIGAVAGVLAYLYFTIFGLIVDRPTRNNFPARVTFALFIFASTDVVRAVTVATMASYLGVVVDINWAFRITASACTGLVLYALVSVVVNDSREFRATAARLITAQHELRVLLHITQNDVARRREELVASVREAIREALTAITHTQGATAASARKTVAELNRVSEEVIRPLSHELHQSAEFRIDIPPEKKPLIRTRAVIENATINAPYRPTVTVIFAFLLMLGQALFGGRLITGILYLAIGLSVMYVYLALFKRFFVPRLRRMHFSARVFWILLTYLVLVVGLGYFVGLSWASVGQIYPWLLTLYAALLGVPFFIFIGVTPGIRAAREAALTDLENTNLQLRRANARLTAQLWVDRKAIARSLHRDVQGVLVAAALRLEKNLDAGIPPHVATKEVRDLIEMAANFAIAPQPFPTTEAMIAALNELWQGVLELDIDVAADASGALQADPVLRSSCYEIIAEFMNNSVRHGKAAAVIVEAQLLPPATLRLQLINDGRHMALGQIKPGLGTELIESLSVATQWTNGQQRGVRLIADLPTA